ncbi:MAG: hypothetical protein GEU90_13235 [Gemmatimonas sp.]|nr:hypothetical protein [Gemmatimonas sp.]
MNQPASSPSSCGTLRDYLLLPGAHWIFVGATGVEHTVFRAYDQVGGIFPAAITLDALSPVDIRELLRLRIEHLTISGARVTVPIGPEEAAVLYRLYQGDLRNFLRLLADAAERILGVQDIRPMAVSEVLQHSAAVYARRLRAVLGDTDFEYLQSVALPMSSRGYEFRVTDATNVLEISQSSGTRLVDRLLSQRVIRQTRTEGGSVSYRPDR